MKNRGKNGVLSALFICDLVKPGKIKEERYKWIEAERKEKSFPTCSRSLSCTRISSCSSCFAWDHGKDRQISWLPVSMAISEKHKKGHRGARVWQKTMNLTQLGLQSCTELWGVGTTLSVSVLRRKCFNGHQRMGGLGWYSCKRNSP